MDFSQALKYVYSANMLGSRLGLENIRKLLSQMGNPHKNLRYIHVAGTNGKGSTTAFISSILMASGYKTGVYTSPHLHSINERISINGINISDEQFADGAEKVQAAADRLKAAGEEPPTQFEIITAIAFQYFYEARCDFVVLEVGLGGRLDATNVIESPEVAVITAIGLDHMERLGSTLSRIAFEKGGIIKPGTHAVLYAQGGDADIEIERICKERAARLQKTNFKKIIIHQSTLSIQEFSYEMYKNLKISLLGKYQVSNAVLAIHAIEILRAKGYPITEESIRKGLLLAKWPGRFEILSKDPLFIVDGAHNMPGVTALEESLKTCFLNKKITFLMGVLSDKPYTEMIQCIAPLGHRFIAVTPKSPRALASAALAEALKEYHNEVISCPDITQGIDMALNLSDKDEVICAFGSLYMAGTIRSYFYPAQKQFSQEI